VTTTQHKNVIIFAALTFRVIVWPTLTTTVTLTF